MKFKNKVALAAMLGVSLLATACSTGSKTPTSSSTIPVKEYQKDHHYFLVFFNWNK